jgi:hypothetical protein
MSNLTGLKYEICMQREKGKKLLKKIDVLKFNVLIAVGDLMTSEIQPCVAGACCSTD